MEAGYTRDVEGLIRPLNQMRRSNLIRRCNLIQPPNQMSPWKQVLRETWEALEARLQEEALAEKVAGFNPQPSTLNYQPSTLSPQP